MKKLANILLGVWLFLTGMIGLTDLRFRASSQLLAITAVISGIFLLLADRNQKIASRAPDLVLGIWLITIGLVGLFSLSFHGSRAVIGALAVAAGVLMLIRK